MPYVSVWIDTDDALSEVSDDELANEVQRRIKADETGTLRARLGEAMCGEGDGDGLVRIAEYLRHSSVPVPRPVADFIYTTTGRIL